MIVGLFSGHDVKSDLWSPPVTMENVDVLEQYLSVMVNSHGNGHYHLYPEDFVFYQIGTFDETTGKVELFKERLFAVNLAGCKKTCEFCPKEELENESV